MKYFLLASTMVLTFSGSAGAEYFEQSAPASSSYIVVANSALSAKDFILHMSNDAISFLDNNGMSQSQKEAEFKKLLHSSFDMKTIGRFALGSYWNTATPAQREEYMRLFENMIVRVYSVRFNDYNGQELDVAGIREEGKDTLVTSYIVPPTGAKVRVDWRVRSKNGEHKIVDVIIEGVSMAMTQRADFSSVIQRGGGNIQVLIDHLKKG